METVSLSPEQYSIKKDEGYDKSNDPIFHANDPESTPPQHGCFAIPLIVIDHTSILFYFTKDD